MYQTSPSKAFGVVYITKNNSAVRNEFVRVYAKTGDEAGVSFFNSGDLDYLFNTGHGNCYYVYGLNSQRGGAYRICCTTPEINRNGVIVALPIDTMDRILAKLSGAAIEYIMMQTTRFFSSSASGAVFGYKDPVNVATLWLLLQNAMGAVLGQDALTTVVPMITMAKNYQRIKVAVKEIVPHWEKLGLNYEKKTD